METRDLAPGYSISRVIRGGWQLAGGHGPVDRQAAVAGFGLWYEAGIVAVDCADIYTGVEELVGEFRADLLARKGRDALDRLKVHTKFVPDLAVLPRIDKEYVRGIIDRSLRRLRAERLDLVQFHWWDYTIPGCIETAQWLDELRREGKIDLLGGTNFDTAHLAAMAAADVPIKTMQVQYSVLDRRPASAMAALCEHLGVSLLCYGSVAGGFLSEKWLGRPEPELNGLENRSLVKYKLIIDDFGGWDAYQALLSVLDAIAKRQGVGLSTIASRYVLEQEAVAAVIVGARSPDHLQENLAIGRIKLSAADLAEIDAVLSGRRGVQGDVYALERDRASPHGAIMKYDLNKE
ncbi:MAG TPA: aldo/keto reductase [Magnetospirillaceae bacterium]|nr:aldo/keto reductase [Magnetospirillaceae bacterium]